MPPRTSAKESILNAAELVVSESGAAHLTLDAVAHKAEVSKGGLLYHFPSKEAHSPRHAEPALRPLR